LHEVDDVPIETRIEAEAMLSGERFSRPDRTPSDRLAPRLAAPIRTPFVHRNGGATIAEFVCGGQSCDATTNDDYLRCHSVFLPAVVKLAYFPLQRRFERFAIC
jgi:hypothetical protein